MGLLPDFLIIGAQRCGTTSLYEYLNSHPNVIPASQKEIHFFDYNFNKGISWYKSQFRSGGITGEASPYYIFHPHSSSRIAKFLPKVKLIILLRNPVDRAYSHYHHEVRIGKENLSFEEAIQEEKTRLSGELDKMINDESYFSFNHQHFTYLARGKYVIQLKSWFEKFSKEQIFILESEIFFKEPNKILKQVFEFLNLPQKSDIATKIFEKGSYVPINKDTRKNLVDYFKPHNKRLYQFLGREFGWDK